MKKVFAIYGAGGSGNEILSFIENDNDPSFKNIFLFDDSKFITRKKIKSIQYFKSLKAKKFINISLQKPSDRKKIHRIFSKYSFFNVKHSTSIILKNSKIQDGYILYPNTVISNDTKIGKLFHLNFFSAIGHNCIIGDYVSVGPKSVCCGNVKIKNNVLIGGGVIINPGQLKKKIVIGNNVTIGMGSVVFDSIPDNCTVVGNPAKVIYKKT